jgi:hypothetical protein
MNRTHSAAGFALLLFFGHLLPAASFVTANCGPAAITSGTDSSTSCHTIAEGPAQGGGASASGSVQLNLAPNAQGFSVLTTHQNVSATEGFPLPGEGSGTGSAGSSSQIHYSVDLATTGPERIGVLQISSNSTANVFKPYDGSGGISFGLDINVLGPDRELPNYTSISCGSFDGCFPGPAFFDTHAPFYTVMLGTPFRLFVDSDLTTYVDRGDGISGGGIDSTFEFRFFEVVGRNQLAAADVVTAAPEPGTIWTLGGGLVIACLFARWKAKAKQL